MTTAPSFTPFVATENEKLKKLKKMKNRTK
jgi:hypothetical protein